MSEKPPLPFRLVRTAFGLAFCIVPGIMLSMVLRDAAQRSEVRDRWTPVACTVLASDVRDARGGYALAVRYRYVAGGLEREGARYGRNADEHSFERVADKARLLAAFAPGTVHEGRVNPADPADVVLVAPDDPLPMTLGVFAFLSIFFAVGLSQAVLPWLPRRKKSRLGPAVPEGAPHLPSAGPGRARRDLSRLPLVLLGAAFLAVPALLGTRLVGSLREARDARGWPVVEATVLRSEVKSEWRSGPKGRGGSYQYEPYLAYAYEVGGARFEGDRLAFVTSTSSDSGTARRIVAEHPVGSSLRVRVSPGDPTRSVVDGAGCALPTAAVFVSIGICLVFGAIGLAVLVSGLSGCFRSASPPPGDLAAPPPPGGVRLRDRRGAELGALVFFAVLWNLIAWTVAGAFLPNLLAGGAPTGEDWLPVLLASAFPLIGLGLAVAFVVRLCALGRDRLRLRAARAAFVRGRATDVAYRYDVRDAAAAPVSLVVSLVGYRTKTAGSGKGAHTVEIPFHRAEVFRSVSPIEIRHGSFRVEIPLDAPPTDRRVEGVRWRLETELRRPGASKPVLDKFPLLVA